MPPGDRLWGDRSPTVHKYIYASTSICIDCLAIVRDGRRTRWTRPSIGSGPSKSSGSHCPPSACGGTGGCVCMWVYTCVSMRVVKVSCQADSYAPTNDYFVTFANFGISGIAVLLDILVCVIGGSSCATAVGFTKRAAAFVTHSHTKSLPVRSCIANPNLTHASSEPRNKRAPKKVREAWIDG